jgi:long-chain acyl-CoA synthetase
MNSPPAWGHLMTELLTCFASATTPSRVVLRDRTQELSAVELTRRVRILAELLARCGCKCVALQADNGCDWVIADLACQEAGLSCVPLPLFFTQAQQQHVFESCGIDAVLTQLPLLATHFREAEAVPGSTLTLLRRPVEHAPELPQGTSKVTFTSGSTGTPKGVCLHTAQQWRQARALREAVGLEAPVHLCVLPLATLLENIAGVYAPLLAGGTVVLRGMAELGFSGSGLREPQKFLDALADVRPDSLILVPQLLRLLVSAVRRGWRAPPLKFIAVGGARVGAGLIHDARALGLPVYEGYGLSECASVVSLNTPAGDMPGSAGRVLPHLDVSIIDDEIQVAGNTMLGYVGEPASWNPPWIATGDLGHVDARGFLHIDGRRKNLLISSYGRNISPEWVESELLGSPLIAEAVVFGDGRPCCVALLTPVQRDVTDIDLSAAIAAVNSTLPDYARVKRWLRLPAPLASSKDLLTANGRPRRERIEELYGAEIEALYAESATGQRLLPDEEVQ